MLSHGVVLPVAGSTPTQVARRDALALVEYFNQRAGSDCTVTTRVHTRDLQQANGLLTAELGWYLPQDIVSQLFP